MAFEIPKLSYAYDALEPHIDARTMEIHHTKHHNGYATNLNNAIAGSDLEGKSIEDILSNLAAAPADKKGAINFNGGGFDNHCIYWANMSPDGGGEPSGALADAIGNSSHCGDLVLAMGAGDVNSLWSRLEGRSAPTADLPLVA